MIKRIMRAVYFVQAEDAAIKIGITTDLQKRFKAMQYASPVKLAMLGAIVGDMDDELALHERFAGLRLHGEWFQPGEELLDYIREHAQPEDVVMAKLEEQPPVKDTYGERLEHAAEFWKRMRALRYKDSELVLARHSCVAGLVLLYGVVRLYGLDLNEQRADIYQIMTDGGDLPQLDANEVLDLADAVAGGIYVLVHEEHVPA